ncbi:uncharacterized protein LOC142354464 [Convolutriloba macropyga]|uniref:uncharacterized protein LOC142354464 n=1 Tax=Convolutriloba macropyga TaxID=536237 RepID=UPI003F51DEB4
MSDVVVEIGDFSPTAKSTNKINFTTYDWQFPSGSVNSNRKRKEDIALIRIYDPNYELNFITQPIPICTKNVTDKILLATSGMGSTSMENDADSSQDLQETFFRQSVYTQPTNPYNFIRCPEGKICTQSVLKGSRISQNDVGGPLYVLSCHYVLAECLYGVASHTYTDFILSSEGQVKEAAYSNVFTSVVQLNDWIFSVIYGF